MSKEIRISNWLQTMANLGIIVGLVLVALQMRQNADLLRAQLIYMESERQLSLENSMLGEDPAAVWAKSVVEGAELDPREARIMDAYLFVQIEQWRSAYNLTETGLIDDEWKYRVQLDTEYVLNNSYGREYWQSVKWQMPSELASYVDEILLKLDEDLLEE